MSTVNKPRTRQVKNYAALRQRSCLEEYIPAIHYNLYKLAVWKLTATMFTRKLTIILSGGFRGKAGHALRPRQPSVWSAV